MSWKFWEKKGETGAPAGTKVAKLPGPKELPYPVGRVLVTELHNDPDRVWQLKAVVRPRPEGGKDAFDVRVFSAGDAAAKNVSVRDYNSFEGENADLILFEGWFDKKSMKAHLEARTKPQAA